VIDERRRPAEEGGSAAADWAILKPASGSSNSTPACPTGVQPEKSAHRQERERQQEDARRPAASQPRAGAVGTGMSFGCRDGHLRRRRRTLPHRAVQEHPTMSGNALIRPPFRGP
jgi:hypothetical protein